MPRHVVVFCIAIFSLAALAPAADFRLPLEKGRVPAQRLLDTIGIEAGLPRAKTPVTQTVDLAGDKGAIFVKHLQATIGASCQASLAGGELVVHIDPKAVRPDVLTLARLQRLLTTGSATRPVVPGDRFGITLPPKFDANKPLLLLIHGIDSDNAIWGSLCITAAGDGVQCACFRYDYNTPIATAGQLLGDCLADLRLAHPELKINLVGHSLGGLVARDYVEGPCYHGGIGRMFLVGTPNHGSAWASWRWALEIYQRCYEGKRDPDFAWTRLCREGSGPAAHDMLPDSAFLKTLNALPRRKDVQYTVIAGDRNTAHNLEAGWVENAAGAVPEKVKNLWGVRQARAALEQKAQSLRQQPSDCDGPVTIESCRLEGASDFTVLHADHMGLVCGYPPGGWAIIKDRLSK